MKIDGLTAQQATLLDKIWCIERESELATWISTLPPKIVDEVSVLIELVIHETIEALIDDMDHNYPQAFNMIMKCK